MALADPQVGDKVAVLNGRQNSVFEAEIREVDADGILVYVPEKDAFQVYHRATGKAVGASRAELVEHLDWRARVLRNRRAHQELHMRVVAAVKRFHETPTPGNAAALQGAVHEWREFVAQVSDKLSLQVRDIQEYLERKSRNDT